MNINSLIGVFAVFLVTALLFFVGASPVAACNRAAGCAMDVLLEGHDMMQDGAMAENMRAAQENIQAFRRQQAADQAAGKAAPKGR